MVTSVMLQCDKVAANTGLLTRPIGSHTHTPLKGLIK